MTATASTNEPELSGHTSGLMPRVRGELPVTTRACKRPTRDGWLARMPRWLRIVLTGTAFAFFFAASFSIGLIAPLLMLLAPKTEDRWRFTRKLNAGMWAFTAFMRDVGLITYWPPVLPPGFEGKPFLLVANHPSLIDVVLTLSSIPQLSCVAKGGWYRSWLMGPLLRRTQYIPGTGFEGDAHELEDVPVVRRIEQTLRSGVPVLVFPEGTRSKARSLQRFTRGAIEAAIRAEVPILPMFISVTPAFLMKGQPFYHVPKVTPVYDFEWFEPVETAGRDLDSKEVARDLQAAFEARFARQVAERDALQAGG